MRDRPVNQTEKPWLSSTFILDITATCGGPLSSLTFTDEAAKTVARGRVCEIDGCKKKDGSSALWTGNYYRIHRYLLNGDKRPGRLMGGLKTKFSLQASQLIFQRRA